MTGDRLRPENTGSVVTIRGIELHANDKSEQHRHKLARVINDSIVHLVGLLDLDGNVIEINPRALEAVQGTLSDVEGKPLWETPWWQASQAASQSLRDAVACARQGVARRWEVDLYGDPAGLNIFNVDVSLTPVRDDNGNVIFITIEAQDITEKRAHEREIARQREELAALDKLKTQFFANISHEFRTPLTLMLGPVEDALNDTEEPLPPRQRQRLEMIERNGFRLQKLVNTLLDFSRVEAGRMHALFQPTDLAAFTQDLASNFRSLCQSAGLSLEVDVPPLPEKVYIDREMWEKIVLNLLSNAFKFTFDGGIKVNLSADHNGAILQIADTGTGIPQSDLPLVFDRFHRAAGARGRSHEGTGIGLALVQELVQMHAGSISVQSEPGKGSTFTVRMPFGCAHLPANQIENRQQQTSNTLGSHPHAGTYVKEAQRWLSDMPHDPARIEKSHDFSPRRAKILVAEDNADLRDYVRRLLLPQHDVIVASDGEEALDVIEREQPDLVLSDIMMPRMDGLTLLRRLRDNMAWRDLPVILLSARAGEEARGEGLQLGADDYLSKPFSARDLQNRVEANLNMARLRRQASDALRHRTAQFETLLNQAPVGVYLIDSDLRLREVNPAARAFFGDVPGGLEGRKFAEISDHLWGPDGTQVLINIFSGVLRTGKPYIDTHGENVRVDRGHVEHYDWRVDRIVLPDGSYGAVAYFREISEQVQSETTRQLLLNELNHRVKNTLATVQAIARQTLRHSSDPEDFATRFSGRIQSLARIHSMLTDAKWQGADLKALILDQLLQGPVDESRVSATGPNIRLRHQTALAMAMMLHELGTNSIKYGALSVPRGHVMISWWLDNEMLHLRWQERGGPKVSAPEHRGFGTMLIEQSVKSEKGDAHALYEEDGVTWNISLALPTTESNSPAADILKAQTIMTKEDEEMVSESQLAGLKLLLVEDDPLIAMDVTQRLEMAGASQVASAGAETEVLELLKSQTFDAALLDANLHGLPVDTLAAELTRHGIPFAFATGYGRDGLPESFQHIPLLAKPFNDQALFDMILTLTQPHGEVLQFKS